MMAADRGRADQGKSVGPIDIRHSRKALSEPFPSQASALGHRQCRRIETCAPYPAKRSATGTDTRLRARGSEYEIALSRPDGPLRNVAPQTLRRSFPTLFQVGARSRRPRFIIGDRAHVADPMTSSSPSCAPKFWYVALCRYAREIAVSHGNLTYGMLAVSPRPILTSLRDRHRMSRILASGSQKSARKCTQKI